MFWKTSVSSKSSNAIGYVQRFGNHPNHPNHPTHIWKMYNSSRMNKWIRAYGLEKIRAPDIPKRMIRAEYVARKMWDLAVHGRIQLVDPSGNALVLELSPKEWMQLAQNLLDAMREKEELSFPDRIIFVRDNGESSGIPTPDSE